MQLQRFRSDPQKRTITTAGVNYSLAAVDAGNPKHAVGDNLRREELANHILNVPASVPRSRKTALYREDDRVRSWGGYWRSMLTPLTFQRFSFRNFSFCLVAAFQEQEAPVVRQQDQSVVFEVILDLFRFSDVGNFIAGGFDFDDTTRGFLINE